MSEQPNYFNRVDLARLTEEFPIGPAFLRHFTAISRDELRALQEERFARQMTQAWKVPFYRRHWGDEGLEPGDIRSLDDIAKLPTFDKSDIMASIAAHPPFGDFHGMETYPRGERPPVILHTTSGTTGRPQVLLYGPRSREIQNLLVARIYLLQGLRPDDVVQSVYGHGMVNGGHYIREAVVHWTNSIFLPAGTGIETRSVQQVALMKDFGVTGLVGFADYIKRLADVAREEGLEPGRDIKIRMISGHMGREDNELDQWAQIGNSINFGINKNASYIYLLKCRPMPLYNWTAVFLERPSDSADARQRVELATFLLRCPKKTCRAPRPRLVQCRELQQLLATCERHFEMFKQEFLVFTWLIKTATVNDHFNHGDESELRPHSRRGKGFQQHPRHDRVIECVPNPPTTRGTSTGIQV